MHHKDYIGENPTADADIKVVSDYTNAVVSGDLVKAKSLLAASYMGYGPGPVDSANVNKEMQSWKLIIQRRQTARWNLSHRLSGY